MISNRPPYLSSEPESANQSICVKLIQSTEGSETLDASERESQNCCLHVETAIAKGPATYPELLSLKKECNKGTMLKVTPEKLHNVLGCGYVSVARILFNPVRRAI